MSDNPYQAPPPLPAVVGIRSGRREDLRKVARCQKALLLCILANVLLLVAAIFVGQGMSPGSTQQSLFTLVFGAYCVTAILQAIFLALLARHVYNLAIGIVLGLFALFMGLGLLILLMVNQKATKVLQDNGIRVGLLGADISQI
jgi:hypothetical protein